MPAPESAQDRLRAAAAALRSGHSAEAEPLLQALLREQPRQAAALLLLGELRARQGQPAEALELVEGAIALDGTQLPAHFARIDLLRALGREAEVDAAYRAAGAGAGVSAEAARAAAAAAYGAGALPEAAHHAALAVALAPEIAAGYLRLGAIQIDRNAPRRALRSAERALALDPGLAEAWGLQGLALERLGEPEKARASCERALALDGACVTGHRGLGDLHQAAGRHQAALPHYRAALQGDPERHAVHFRLAGSLAALHDYAGAERHYRKTLERFGGWAGAHSNLASTLTNLGRIEAAEAACLEALRLDPALAEAHGNLGNIRLAQRRASDAEACFRRALERHPNNGPLHSSLGNALLHQCRVEEAAAAYRRSVDLNPRDPSAHSNLLFSLNYRDPPSQAWMLAEHRRYGEAREAEASRLPTLLGTVLGGGPAPEGALRVGLVSPDLRRHTMAQLLEGLIAHHAAGGFELVCYADTALPDEVTERLRAMGAEWREVAALDDDELGRQVRTDGIQILLDAGGHAARNRLPLFARRAAPVQASYMGYLNTTGLREMDYWITDGLQNPPETQAAFTERLWVLPRCFACYTPAEESPPVAEAPLLRNGHVTLGFVNNGAKISPRAVRTWSALLRAAPEARLLLKAMQFADGPTCERVRGWFAVEGIAPERLDFIGGSERAAYFEDFARIDLALDPFPYNGTNSTCDALWMGVPVVSLAGDASISRTGVSLLTAVGHPEWIAPDEAAYVEIALGLARDPETLVALRAGLRSEFSASPICDGPGFARALGDAFRGMWEAHGGGERR